MRRWINAASSKEWKSSKASSSQVGLACSVQEENAKFKKKIPKCSTQKNKIPSLVCVEGRPCAQRHGLLVWAFRETLRMRKFACCAVLSRRWLSLCKEDRWQDLHVWSLSVNSDCLCAVRQTRQTVYLLQCELGKTMIKLCPMECNFVCKHTHTLPWPVGVSSALALATQRQTY